MSLLLRSTAVTRDSLQIFPRNKAHLMGLVGAILSVKEYEEHAASVYCGSV